MLDAGRLQIAEQLGNMLVEHSSDSLEFQNKSAFHQRVSHQVAEQGAILIIDLDGHLLLDLQTKLSQTVHQGILIDLLDVALAMIAMDGKSSFTNDVTQLKCWMFGRSLHSCQAMSLLGRKNEETPKKEF
jgi:hypothetical protein